MTLYSYRAVDVSGQEVAGVLEAPTEEVLLGQVEEKRLSLISIEEAEKRERAGFNPLGGRVSKSQLANYSNHLSAMLSAGLPLITALETLTVESESPRLGRVSRDVAEAIGNGRPFSDALSDHPEVFDELYVSMVSAGEESGTLPTILTRNASFLEKQADLAGKVRDALVYPAIVGIVAIAIIGAMLTFVIPKFIGLLEKVGAEIPWPTRVLIALSDLLVTRWHLIAIGMIALIGAAYALYSHPRSRFEIDRWKLRLPVAGAIFVRISASRLARTLSTLLEAGLPVLKGLDLVQRVLGNTYLEDFVKRSAEQIRDGSSLTEPLKREGVFPPMMIQMIHVGESSGSLDQMLARVADLYEKEVDRAAKRLSVLLEPAMIVLIGIFVSFVALALLLPMVKAISSIGH